MQRRAAIVLAVIAVLLLAVAAWAWVHVPELYPTPAPSGDQSVDATDRATQAQAIVTTRASVLAALAGLGALVTIAINYRNSAINNRNVAIANRNAEIAAETLATTNRTFEITARGHLTDRYTKAIEQLGNTNSLAIRLGGIYALQQFASETDRDEDQATVVEVLSAFVRTNLPRWVLVGTAGQLPAADRVGHAWEDPEPDVLAAISVLAQLPYRADVMRADFTGVDFDRVRLTQARLRNGDLRQVRLSGASFHSADLRDANLSHALLAETDFGRANLTGANLSGANLSGAELRDATLTDTRLTNAVGLGGAALPLGMRSIQDPSA